MATHPNTFRLVIASVGETYFDGAAISATLPGESGELTVLPHHEPLVTPLKKGIITVRATTEIKTFPVESGVLECTGGRVIVLL